MSIWCSFFLLFFFNVTAPPGIYTLSLHDALPIWVMPSGSSAAVISRNKPGRLADTKVSIGDSNRRQVDERSEEHTSELQSRFDLVCRLLLEKKKCPSTVRSRSTLILSVW